MIIKSKNFDQDFEGTLYWIQLNLEIPQSYEGFLQVREVLIRMMTFDKHVIHIDLHVVIGLISKYLVDQPLIGHSDILESKGHNFVVV